VTLPADKRVYKYNPESLMPYTQFFKVMARKPGESEQAQKSVVNRLRIWIPDTVVLNDGELPPIWIYSNA
jgi:LMBR1 domain-containing protein 1